MRVLAREISFLSQLALAIECLAQLILLILQCALQQGNRALVMTVEELDVAKGLCSRASPKDLGIRCLPKTRTTRGGSRAPSETSSAINSSAFVIAMVRKLAKDRHLAIATRGK